MESEPVLAPKLPEERWGAIANGGFLTSIDRRNDPGTPNCLDVSYALLAAGQKASDQLTWKEKGAIPQK
ncbi:MAG: hypothetical protein HGA45_24440 [Chloroflexales bacterium]|nr:hypothetical protein [Chloroflexales bacterium]